MVYLTPEQMQSAFFAVTGVFVVYRMVRGWQLGVVRQAIGLLALGAAYAVAIFGGPLSVPILRPLGYPDALLRVAGGAVFGLIVFLAISGIGAVLFKKTGQQELGIVRFFYGVGGALLGACLGLFLVWVAIVGVRLTGTVAQVEARPVKRGAQPMIHKPLVQGLAQLKTSMDSGIAAPVIEKVDPIPKEAYSVIGKLTRLIASPESTDRFLDYPGVKTLSVHPKIVALKDDPLIAREIRNGRYLTLLNNKQIVAAANDPDLAGQLRRFELEKALDYALQSSPGLRPPAKH